MVHEGFFNRAAAERLTETDVSSPSMDELDSEIVRLLQTDARRSNRELARQLGIAPSTCL
jgi:AsnC-type helix-turn-helix domain